MPIRAIQTALSDAPAELVVVRPGKDRGSARVRSAAAAPEKGAQRIQAQTLLQLLQSERIDRLDASKSTSRDARIASWYHSFGARGGSCGHGCYNRRCRRCLVDGPVFIPGDHRLHDCSAQRAKCDVTPGERSPLAARNLARVGAFP